MRIPEGALCIMERLEEKGYRTYLVGGCVRDLLLGREPDDWDLTTAARPEQVLELFGDQAIPTGLKHGTVTVRQGGLCCEVTTFRCDGPYADGRHPQQVTFAATLEEDLSRRDLTINAMAMDAAGQVTDPYGGRQDLEQGVIRCVGKPQARFDEDALRILRALRFAARFSFRIEERTTESIHRCAGNLTRIAPERIREEMEKLLLGAGAVEILLNYPDVLGVFLPEVLPCVGFDQQTVWHCYTVWEHIVHSVALVPEDPILRWTMLLHDLAKPQCFTVDGRGKGHFHGHPEQGAVMAVEIMDRLRFDRRSSQTIERLIRWHDRRPLPQSREHVLRWLNRLGPETFHLLMAVKRADLLAQNPKFHGMEREICQAEELALQLQKTGDCWSVSQLAVTGKDLLELGLEGPQIGEALDQLLEQVMAGQCSNQKQDLLEWLHSRK